MIDVLKTKVASRIANNYYLEPCIVNEDPLEPGKFAVPNDTVLIDPPKDQKPYKKYKLNESKNEWIEEIDYSKVICFDNHIFYYTDDAIRVLNLLLCLDLKVYQVADADGNMVILKRKQLKRLAKEYAYMTLKLLGYPKSFFKVNKRSV